MEAAKAAGSRAFVVWFKEAGRWNPGSFIDPEWRWPEAVICPLAEVLTPCREPCNPSDWPKAHPPLVTIRFDGSMERRDADPTAIKGRLFLARAGDLVYSKIDIRNGAIGVVPDALPVIAVTSDRNLGRQ